MSAVPAAGPAPMAPGGGLPWPKPDLARYAAELEACLAASPFKRENRDRLLAADRTEAVDYEPMKMDFENVSRCNFRCTKCQSLAWQGRRARDMEVEEFAGLLEAMPGLVELKLQGVGEPLLGGDAYFAMIRLARRQRIWVRTTTNASLLHLHDNARRLIDADPCEVQISIDGASREVMEEIRRGSNFAQVTANCRLLNDCAESANRRVTRMWTCLQRQNLPELLALVRLAATLGFPRLTFSLDLHDWGQQEIRDRLEGLSVSNEEVCELGMQAVELGQSLGVDVSFWQSVEKYSTASVQTLCPWPFERSFVSSDMRVCPCCMIANPDIFSLGQADAFPEVWHGPAYAAFRRAHLEGRPPRVCTTCYAMPAQENG